MGRKLQNYEQDSFASMGINIGAICIGLGIIGYGIKIIYQGLLTRQWNVTRGVIIRAEALQTKNTDTDNERIFKPKVAYRYKVNGVEYQASGTSINIHGSSAKDGIEQIIQDYGYQVDQPVFVYYHPEDPKRATLTPGVPWAWVSIVMALGLALLSIAIYPIMLGIV